VTVATQTTTTILRRKRYAFFSFVSLGLLHWRQCLFTFPLQNTPRVKGLKHKIESSVQCSVCNTMMQCFKVNIALHAMFIFSNVNTPCLLFSFFLSEIEGCAYNKICSTNDATLRSGFRLDTFLITSASTSEKELYLISSMFSKSWT
jgi:hypothetical protein